METPSLTRISASLDLSEVVTVLSAISSMAVIAGAGFIVVQLRQNARLLDASLW
jgi:hypothetical protein